MATTSLQTATQPNWAKTTIAFNPRTRKYEVTPASRGGEEMYVDPVTGKYVLPMDYLFTANTPEAIQYRANNSSLINLIKNTGLDYRAGQNLFGTVQSYNNVVSNADQTEALRNYLGQQLKNLGINSFTQIEKRVVDGKDKYYNKTTGKEIDNVLFDDKAGTKYLLTDQGIQKQFDPIAQQKQQTQQARINFSKLVQPTSSGEAWQVLGAEAMLDQLNERVRAITGGLDLSQIAEKSFPVTVPATVYGVYDDNTGKTNWYAEYLRPGQTRPEQFSVNPEGLNLTYAGKITNPNQGYDWQTVDAYSTDLTLGTVKRLVNKQTGEIIPGSPEGKATSFRLKSGMSNENYTKPDEYDLGGWDFKDLTYASLTFDANGNPQIKTWGKTSNNAAEYIAPLSIALMAIPGIGQAVGAALLPSGVSVATATAVGNAVINAGLQVASGVPVEKAILNSAVSLGVSQLVPNLSGNVYVDNAVKSVATAALTGGDVGNALANSLIATGGNELLGNTSFTGDKVVDSAIASAIISGVQAAATDGDVGASAIKGALAGASGQLTKEEKMAESARSGAGFIGEDVTAPINVADVIGNDTVTSGSGIDSVNAGVAQDNVLDLVQQDIDRISSNNVQDVSNVEQEVQPVAPVEPGIDPRILAQGVTGGQFGEGGFLQTGAQVPLDVLQDLMKLRPELVSIIDSGNYYLKVPTADGAYTAYEISPSGQVLNAQPGLSVGETYDPSKTASALEERIKIEEGKSSQQAVPEGSGLSGSVQPKATDLSPAAQETLLQIGGVLGLGEQDPDAVYEALIGGASGGIGDVALLGYDQLAKLQDEIEIIFDEPNLPADAKSEMARIYAEVTNQKRIQEEAIRDQLLNDQQPTEQQVADTGLTVVGQPVNQTPVVSSTTPSFAPPTIAPVVTEPVVSQPVVAEPVTKEPVTPEIITNVPSTTPQITQPVDQALTVITPTPPPSVIEPTPPTSGVTGIVLQNNGDGTALVLTNDGNAANVPATDARSNEPLTPGSSVTIDQNTNTATVTPPASDGGAQAPIVSAPPAVQDTGDQQVLGGGQQPTTDAGSIIDTPIGPDTSTTTVPEPVVQEPVVQEPPPPPPPPPAVPTTPEEPITEPPQEPVVDKTEEDLLLEQIIRELEPTPPVSEGVPIQEPEFPEPPLVLPESPTINVADRLTIRSVVDRGYRRPSVSPGSRVEESAQILPIRPGLSEGGTGGIEGTTEQEQEPVWNVRSLKLRRLLGI